MGKREKGGGSMVAPHPRDTKLYLVEALAAGSDLTAGELAGLRRATGWEPGKQVTEEQFQEAVRLFRGRAMGSGRI